LERPQPEIDLMAAKEEQGRRKLVEFDAETWAALDTLAQDRLASFQELADEAFRDLLRKHHRPVGLRAALKASAEAEAGKRRDRAR
jgi:uncharacterized membrane-anchored protein YhcB (DUF1043 family)